MEAPSIPKLISVSLQITDDNRNVSVIILITCIFSFMNIRVMSKNQMTELLQIQLILTLNKEIKECLLVF